MEILGQNIAMESDLQEVLNEKFNDSSLKNIEVIKTNKKKIIAGFEADEYYLISKKDTNTFSNSDSNRIDTTSVYMCKEINPNYKLTTLKTFLSEDFKKNFSFAKFGILAIHSKYLVFEAKEVKRVKLNDSIFTIPVDYKKMQMPKFKDK